MLNRHWRRQALACALAFCCTSLATAADLGHPDHYEFDANLSVPFNAVDAKFPIRVDFDYPGAGNATRAAWMVDVIAPSGRIIGSDSGIASLKDGRGFKLGRWNGLDANGRALPSGYYTVRLRAVPTITTKGDARLSVAQQVRLAFATFHDEVVEQRYDVMLGKVPAADVKPIAPLPMGRQSAAATGAATTQKSIAATGGLPYTIYYGNMHSQTNHSDGGTPVASCGGSEVPQGGTMGPAEAYTMMRTQAGGDFLLTSEHNHMYDGSTGTNTSASPTTANNLFSSGLQAAASARTANPGFMALYGLEWGVISNGGHLNIINPDVLAEWEYNGSSQLIGGVFTAKNDYAGLYAVMKQRGWIGQFNHPATTGQFQIGGVSLAYDANGADVMVLAEVMNSSAFSTNTTQTEVGRSNYGDAWNKLLEAGYHVAPSSDQDNHCANWGLSFTNRTGVLLPSGTALTTTAFYDALRARRVFATEDRTSQLVLTANGHVMGESFANTGNVTLTANFASTSGQTAQRVQFFEGVPGRKGTVTQLTEGSGSYTFTPATGQHFYYALVTQANGLRLWSAPVWVDQGGTPPTDTTPPTVSASETGTSGTISLAATASDNVGVSRVEFYVDGVLVGTDTTATYGLSLDSTTLANGSHTLTAKAYDAANNVGTSSAVAFSVSNTTSAVERIVNGGFESGSTSWTATSGVISSTGTLPARTGTWRAWLNGYGATHTDSVYQTVSIPAAATSATLTFWLRVDSAETTTTNAYDTLTVQVRNSSNTVLGTLATYSNLNKGTSYVQRSFNLSAYKGQTIRVYFLGVEGSQVATSFLIDDVSLMTQ